METMLMLLISLVLFYFILVLPIQLQGRRRRKEQASLAPGDEIETEGGLIGTIVEMSPYEVRLQLAEGVEARITPQSIRGRRRAPAAKKGVALAEESGAPESDREEN